MYILTWADVLFFLWNISAFVTFSVQCSTRGVVRTCLCIVPSCIPLYRPIPASPDTPTGAANTSGVVFQHPEIFKLFLRHTPLAFSLCRLLLVGSSSNSLACFVIIQSVLLV